MAAQVLKFSDAPPVHRPLTGKGWRGFPTPHLASTDDKESAIIAIFIDLVIFPLSSGLPAPIWRELAALGRHARHALVVTPDHSDRSEFTEAGAANWYASRTICCPATLYSFRAKPLN
ncbi:MAG: hypothetical protein ACREYA_12685 [Cupriavidus necator]